jgi:hypothetical protein
MERLEEREIRGDIVLGTRDLQLGFMHARVAIR